MMLEKKTTKNIIDTFESIGNDPQNEEFLNKVWVSQESLIEYLLLLERIYVKENAHKELRAGSASIINSLLNNITKKTNGDKK